MILRVAWRAVLSVLSIGVAVVAFVAAGDSFADGHHNDGIGITAFALFCVAAAANMAYAAVRARRTAGDAAVEDGEDALIRALERGDRWAVVFVGTVGVIVAVCGVAWGLTKPELGFGGIAFSLIALAGGAAVVWFAVAGAREPDE